MTLMSTGVCRGVLAFGIGGLLLLSGCDQGDFARGFKVNPDLRREQWLQPVASQVDVLFVIDTSCSMSDEQEALAENGPSFTSFFVESAIPLHIGVTSTNVGEQDTALEELGGSTNEGFERDEANLVVIIVSDEPDFSETDDVMASSWINWEDFADWLDGYKGPGTAHRTQLSAIVGVGEEGFDDPNGCNQDETGEHGSQGAKRGTGYLEAVEATAGHYQSICTEDWGQVLERMGLLAAGLMDTFVMSELPQPQSIQVEVNGRSEPRWVLLPQDNAIYFEEVDAIPAPGSEVAIQYTALGSD